MPDERRTEVQGAELVDEGWWQSVLAEDKSRGDAPTSAPIETNDPEADWTYAHRLHEDDEPVELLVTGIAIEIALAPIALFHFHHAGLYGAIANIIAIPLTSIVIMPLEALALLFDLVGLGGIFWALCGFSLDALIRWRLGDRG